MTPASAPLPAAKLAWGAHSSHGPCWAVDEGAEVVYTPVSRLERSRAPIGQLGLKRLVPKQRAPVRGHSQTFRFSQGS
jgi:hypothetical protein